MSEVIDRLCIFSPYELDKTEKEKIYKEVLSDLTRHHYESCPEYRRILDVLGYDVNVNHTIEEQLMIPVRLFKEYNLFSVPEEHITKVMTSSGTSGQKVSRIFLDKENTKSQTKVLAEIISSFIGKQRLPLLILDTKMALRDRSMFSARGAGIIGFSTFGRDVAYALDENMKIDIQGIQDFVERHQEKPVLMFGYTYMIWQYIVCALREAGIRIPIKNGSLFHIGGWKKLKDQAVDTQRYNQAVQEVLGNVKVYNYYGMAEQLGSVFVECEYGHMHCSNYSDVVIRRPEDFSPAKLNEKGLIELVSLLPTSYPGHVLLTEDEGQILGQDDCPCGRKGKYFKIYGRIKGAEIRGCSDTYERK